MDFHMKVFKPFGWCLLCWFQKSFIQLWY